MFSAAPLKLFVALLALAQGGPALATGAAGDVHLRELADGVWLHESSYTFPGGSSYTANGLVVRDGRELTLVDSAWGEARTARLLERVAAKIRLPVTRAVVTHYHGDRTAGVDLLEERGVTVFAHPLTQRLAMQHGLPVPDTVLETLEKPGDLQPLGALEVLFPGPAHTMENVVVWLPAQRILFGGCAIRPAAATGAGNTAHGDLDSWLEVLGMLERRFGTARLVVPGHGAPGGPELFAHTARLVRQAQP